MNTLAGEYVGNVGFIVINRYQNKCKKCIKKLQIHKLEKESMVLMKGSQMTLKVLNLMLKKLCICDGLCVCMCVRVCDALLVYAICQEG